MPSSWSCYNGRRSRPVCRYNWWLRSAAGGSSANACYVNNNGNANYTGASNDWIRPRVGFPHSQTK
ncbi:DUF6273 domain-containing protein [uncultured Senegalimassilia sp.]|uniref:DUF6273 domain-containing protein n=1 Tax=uncultured Senegalimassilia sp. TaxID=1714350 RepID=UPI00338F3DBF